MHTHKKIISDINRVKNGMFTMKEKNSLPRIMISHSNFIPWMYDFYRREVIDKNYFKFRSTFYDNKHISLMNGYVNIRFIQYQQRNHINWKCNISSLGISRNVVLTHSLEEEEAA